MIAILGAIEDFVPGQEWSNSSDQLGLVRVDLDLDQFGIEQVQCILRTLASLLPLIFYIWHP